jgi:hypothetical protein
MRLVLCRSNIPRSKADSIVQHFNWQGYYSNAIHQKMSFNVMAASAVVSEVQKIQLKIQFLMTRFT